MATVTLGNIKLNWKGAYNAGTAYAIDDVVSYNGSSYVAKTATTGNLPTVTANWDIMSQAGTNGTNGTDLTSTLTTQGDIVYRDGSGLARLGYGTSGQVLQTGGSGANPSWVDQSGGATEIISHTTLDSTGVNTITTTTNWATNNYWKIAIFSQYQMSTSNHGVNFRFRNASGDISSGDYAYIGYSAYDLTNHSGAVFGIHKDLNGSRDNLQVNGWGYNSSMINPNFEVNVFKPDANNRQMMTCNYLNSDTNPYFARYNFNGWSADSSTKTGFSFIGNSSANMKNGFITMIGYKYQ